MRSVGQTALLCGFVLAGVVATSVLCWQIVATVSFLNRSARADGIVVDARAHPFVAFTTANGTKIRFQQNGHLSAPEGTPVTVAYEPADPQNTARVHSFWADWGTLFDTLPVTGLFIVAMALSLAGLFRR